MSTVLVIAPMISAAWPVLAATITSAAHTCGFFVDSHTDRCEGSVQSHSRTGSLTQLELDASHILSESLEINDAISLERNGVRATIRRDSRGGLQVCLQGTGETPEHLSLIGEELIGRITQQYVYHRVVTELKRRNLTIFDEELSEDRSIRIRVRNL